MISSRGTVRVRQVLHARGQEVNAASTDCVPASLFAGVEERRLWGYRKGTVVVLMI
jgi:hypothetical protein